MREIKENWRYWNLSPNFQLREFVVSHDFPDLALKIVPTTEQVDKINLLTIFALQPIRNQFGKLRITSGLVSDELNKARGSITKDSQHLYGEAVDFVVDVISMAEVYYWCKDILKWQGELILYPKRGHIHLSLQSLWVKANQFIETES